LTLIGYCDNYFIMAKHPAPITDLLRQTIIDSGMTFLELERATGLKRASIMRFVQGSQSLRLDMADRLAVYFGLEVRAKRSKQEGR
jgi:plasmid maintenance system antidote protein VapI